MNPYLLLLGVCAVGAAAFALPAGVRALVEAWRRRDPIPNILLEAGIGGVTQLDGVQFFAVFPRSLDQPTKIYFQSGVDVERAVTLELRLVAPTNERFEWRPPAVSIGPGEVVLVEVSPPIPSVRYPGITLALSPRIEGPRGSRYRRARGRKFEARPSDARVAIGVMMSQLVPILDAKLGPWLEASVRVTPNAPRADGTLSSRILWTPKLWDGKPRGRDD